MYTSGERQTLNEVLIAELACLRSQQLPAEPPATYESSELDRKRNLQEI
jgi:hypothetical protein